MSSPSGAFRGWLGAAAVLVLMIGFLPRASAEGLKTRRRSDGVVVIYSVDGTASRQAPGLSQRRPAPEELVRMIEGAAREHRVDPLLVTAVIEVESAYDRRAVSPKGAQGLMQLMPETARELGVRNAFDAAENVQGGTRYLRQMIDRFDGSLELALASYNAGPEAVERYGGVPPYEETENYVRRVFRAWGREASEWPVWSDNGRRSVRVEKAPGGQLRIVTP